MTRCWAAAAAGLLAGCAAVQTDLPVNPSFPITHARAEGALTADAALPRPLRRPLVIVGGFTDPGFAARLLTRQFREVTDDRRIAAVSLGWDRSFDECRADIIAATDLAFPTDDPAQTTEVDVVGVSMGGLAARYAAASPRPADPPHRRRLRIARLFTISSPLRGAKLADEIPFDLHPLQPAMRTGSWLYRLLNDGPVRPADVYAVYSYVRLRDDRVGTANAAVPGVTPWWLSAPRPPASSHHAVFADVRILADIVARLRGDEPFTRDPPTPIPAGGE